MKVKLGGDFGKVPDSKPAPVGLYVGKIANVDERPSKAGEDMIEVRWTLVKGGDGKKLKEQYDAVFTYHPLDPDANWARRMKELLVALGTKTAGAVDIKTGAEALLRLKEGEDLDGNYKPNVSKIMKLGDAAANGAAEAAADEDEDEEEEEELDLADLNRKQLLAFIKEHDLGIKTRGKDDDTLRELITEAMGDEEEEEEEEEDEDEVDLDEMDRKELKAFIKERGLSIKVTTKKSDDDLRSEIEDALAETDEEEEEEEEEEAEDDNYDELDLDTLRQECKDRDLPSGGKKAVLISRLRKDDAEEPV